MISQIEKTILSAYLLVDSFNRTTTAHINANFFESDEAQKIAKICIDFTTQNQVAPTKVALTTIVEEQHGVNETTYQNILSIVDSIYQQDNVVDIKQTDSAWLLNTTEKWCKERSVYNAILKSIDILDGKAVENKKVLDKSIIPDLMQKALAISFDSSIGHNYIQEYADRYEYMHAPTSKIPFAIPMLNKITGGGIEKKSLSIVLCPPHAGKSLTLGSWSADWIRMGYNVLVITLEMAEMKIGERIDANMLNVDIGQLKNIPRPNYIKKFEEFKSKGYGTLIIKEYPTSSAGAVHFRFLLSELEIKQGFVPDIVVVDYMGICVSSRYKSTENMYQVQKAVGEELRGLAQEKDFALVTAIQTNKNGYNGADFDMGDISESSGHAMTADFMIGLISTEELIALGQVRVKQLKNRWGSIHDYSTFLLNMDRRKMKLYEEGGFTEHIKKMETPKNEVQEKFPEPDAPFVFDKAMIRPKRNIASDIIV